ncbi:hypothetical protein PVAND_014403 [Polypedilum vanderplanki]|uniref:Uncharacterized protein n=1 Tax=Polypedilum vanderplanki TaxID=319348 RepID=A0A9J6B9A9_POLVA|nr:hypothetical protein PVAND_014403 [Polypedilum vanderplanki]
MLNMNLFLFDCCVYPIIPRQAEVYDVCLNSCSEFDYCCFQECSARESGTYVNNVINVNKTKEIFAMQKDFKTFLNLTDEWKNVIDFSVDKCSVMKSSDAQKPCEFIYEYMACIFKENFVNCPQMKDKNECREVKSEMEECSKSKGSWRFITDAFNTVKPSFARKMAESNS